MNKDILTWRTGLFDMNPNFLPKSTWDVTHRSKISQGWSSNWFLISKSLEKTAFASGKGGPSSSWRPWPYLISSAWSCSSVESGLISTRGENLPAFHDAHNVFLLFLVDSTHVQQLIFYKKTSARCCRFYLTTFFSFFLFFSAKSVCTT